MLLLTGIVFLMGIVHTFISPERSRALLAVRRLGSGNAMAAGLGIFTPFYSCSVVPLFIGLLQAGVSLGVTFLISAPMVNEVALALLFSMLGWQVAALYPGLSLAFAIFAWLVICGAAWVMLIADKHGCMPSFMGLILLMGIVVMNGILLVDFAQDTLRRGEPLKQAILDVVNLRTRPILMTAAAAAVGMVPVLLYLLLCRRYPSAASAGS